MCACPCWFMDCLNESVDDVLGGCWVVLRLFVRNRKCFIVEDLQNGSMFTWGSARKRILNVFFKDYNRWNAGNKKNLAKTLYPSVLAGFCKSFCKNHCPSRSRLFFIHQNISLTKFYNEIKEKTRLKSHKTPTTKLLT